MTAPPHGLGAHHHRSRGCRTRAAALRCRPRNQLVERLAELCRLHVIRVAAEALVFPRRIEGIAARLPQAAKSSEVAIRDSGCRQRGLERLARELRMATRSRDGPDVAELFDAVR